MILRAQRPIKEGLEVCISYISIMQGKKISLHTLENQLSLPNLKNVLWLFLDENLSITIQHIKRKVCFTFWKVFFSVSINHFLFD